MSKKKIIIYLVVILLLFQTTISSLINIDFIEYIDEILTVILFVVAIISVIKRKKISKSTIILVCLILVFSIIGIISCYVNSEFILSRVLLSNFLSIKFFIIIISFMNINFKEETKKYFIDALKMCAKVVAVFAIINFIIPEIYTKYMSFTNLEYRFGFPAVCSLFEHPGKYGWFMLFISLYYYTQFKYNEKKDYKKLAIFIFYALLALLSLRTKVIVSLIAILVLENLLSGSKNKKIINMTIITVIAIFIIILFKDVLMNTYKLYFTQENGVSARQSLMDNSFKILQEYFPLGVGFGQYGSWYARVYYSDYYYKYNMNRIYGLKPNNSNFATDTFWPSIFGETGVIGTIVYIALIGYTMYLLFKRTKIFEKPIVIWAMLALLQTFCESFGEQSFYSPPQGIFVSILIGIALSYLEKPKKEKENNEKE